MKPLNLHIKVQARLGKVILVTLYPGGSGCSWELDSDDVAVPHLKEWMEAYALGRVPKTLPAVSLEKASPFQAKVLEKLATIAYGKTCTYKQLASMAGNEKAARAAGTACAKNPIPLLIPCHRVLASSGRLGGFAYGLPLKEELLEFEKAGMALA